MSYRSISNSTRDGYVSKCGVSFIPYFSELFKLISYMYTVKLRTLLYWDCTDISAVIYIVSTWVDAVSSGLGTAGCFIYILINKTTTWLLWQRCGLSLQLMSLGAHGLAKRDDCQSPAPQRMRPMHNRWRHEWMMTCWNDRQLYDYHQMFY